MILTARVLDGLKPRATVYRVWDGIQDPLLRGFGVVVSPAGTLTFILSYTSPRTGKRGQISLGIRSRTFGLTQAREAARALRQQIREGIDPRMAKEAAQAAVRKDAAMGTVADLLGLYLQDLEMDGKARSAAFARSAFARDVLPTLGSRKARDVTPDDVADILAAIARRGALIMANRTRAYLVAAWNFGRRVERLPRWRGKVPPFGVTANPAKETEKALAKEPRGRRWLTPEEVRQVWHALEGADIHTAIALRLLLATGQRVEEVLRAEWSEFGADVWTIPASHRKAGDEPHLVPLTQFHLDLIAALPRKGPWLFPRRDGTGPRDFRSLTRAVARLCDRLGMPRWSPRDCRRSWKTITGSLGIDLEVRNRIQGHGFSDVGSLHYDRFDYLDAKRKGMETYCAALAVWVSR